MATYWTLIGATILGFLLPLPDAQPVVVHLKAGTTIRGLLLEDAEDEVLLRIPFGKISIDRIDILQVEKESEYDYYVHQGKDLLEHGSFEGAVTHFREALRLRPGSAEARSGVADAWNGKGDLLQKHRRLKESIVAYDSALEMDRDHGAARSMRIHVQKVIELVDKMEKKAVTLSRRGDFAEAASHLEQAIILEPSRWFDWSDRLGKFYRKAGDQLYRGGRYEEAGRAYDLALRADPELVAEILEARIYCDLRKAHEQMKAREMLSAEDIVSSLRFTAPYHPRILYAAGRIDQMSGNLIAARDAYLRVLGETRLPVDSTDLNKLSRRAREALGSPPVVGVQRKAIKIESGEWSELKVGPIRIFHKQPDLARDVALSAEYYLDVLPPHLSPHPRPNPLIFDVWIHPDRDSYLKGGGGGPSILKRDSVGRITIQIDVSRPQALSCDLPREMGRLLHRALQSFRKVHPPWVEEGMAARCEPAFKRLHYLDRVANAYREGEKNPIARVLKGARISGELERAKAYALVEYLVAQRGIKYFTEAVDDFRRYKLERFLTTRYGIESRFGLDPVELLAGDLREWVYARSRLEDEE
ncbi:MAG: tetratricopeptide repeat protein [Planctomycetota bacterium]|nr:tetratricopeptide repeat protein [Planctomycetota bacterium]